MPNTEATVGSPLRRYLRIGPNDYPIYGGDDCGWSIDEQDFSPSEGTRRFRYHSLDELIFVLVNFHVGTERHVDSDGADECDVGGLDAHQPRGGL